MPAAYIQWCRERERASSVTNFEAHNRAVIKYNCGVHSSNISPASADAAPCPCLPLLLENAYITGLWTKSVFALCFLLQEEQMPGSDPFGWWSELLARAYRRHTAKRGITIRALWESRKRKENWKTGPANANKCAPPCLWARYIIRNYIDLNCHLSGNPRFFCLCH